MAPSGRCSNRNYPAVPFTQMKYDMEIRLTTTPQGSCWIAQKWCVTGADNTKEGLLVHIRFNPQPMAVVYQAGLQYVSMRGKGVKMKFRIVLVMLLSFTLAGCGVNKAPLWQDSWHYLIINQLGGSGVDSASLF